ncbi:peptidase S8/S53 domain-containing protein [Mycena polygramma]|nr:peptidase S8/S53 domain-containing protein [Mycena polygramma]
MFTAALAFVTALDIVSSSPSPRSFSVHEQRANIAHGWSIRGLAPSTAPLPLKIGLRQSNTDKLYDHLLKVSHPASKTYGKHWTTEEVKAYFRPSEESLGVVMDWLEEVGIERHRISLSKGENWVHVKDTNVKEVEQILNTEYRVYEHIHGDTRLGCSSYAVPLHVQPHIEIITPTLHFDGLARSTGIRQQSARNFKPGEVSAPKRNPSPQPELANCDVETTIPCYRALYNIPAEPTIRAATKNSFGIVAYTPLAYVASDLDLFFANFSPSLVGSRPELISIDGGVVQTEVMVPAVNLESNFDLSYAMTLVGPGQPVRLYQVGDLALSINATAVSGFNNFLDALDGSYCTAEGGDDPSADRTYPDPAPGGFNEPEDCGNKELSNVISVSFARNEAEYTPFYERRQCNEYGKLGLMGVTFLFSSGDSGVAGNNKLCIFPNGTQSAEAPRFNPQFPANCPFVTAVSATQINPGSSVYDPESAASLSGGGFSDIFALPDYQQKAVANYYKDHKPAYGADRYNDSQRARGIPDFSVNGVNITLYAEGNFTTAAGTSAAPPVIGAMITLINDARLAAGKSPVGFINPAIYSDHFNSAFNDIVSGNNPGCGTDGFEAVEGWDPVSGLGTPDFAKLLNLWMSLP